MSTRKVFILSIIFTTLMILYGFAVFMTSRKPLHGETIGGREYANTEKTVLKRWPIIEILPFKSIFFTVDYGLSPTKKDDPYAYALFVIMDSEDSKVSVEEWIKHNGFNPSDYEIIYSIDKNLSKKSITAPDYVEGD